MEFRIPKNSVINQVDALELLFLYMLRAVRAAPLKSAVKNNIFLHLVIYTMDKVYVRTYYAVYITDNDQKSLAHK